MASKSKIKAWKLQEAKKETEHPFLNFYTLKYKVDKEEGEKDYEYYMVSRCDSSNLRSKTQDHVNPDAVIIGLYKQEDDGVHVILSKQFRPAYGDYVYSVPAGLIDKGENIQEAAKREAKEEAGVIIKNIETLSGFAPTNTGMTDEADAFVLAEIDSFVDNDLEEFEDINAYYLPLTEVMSMMKKGDKVFAMNAMLFFYYMNERFGK